MAIIRARKRNMNTKRKRKIQKKMEFTARVGGGKTQKTRWLQKMSTKELIELQYQLATEIRARYPADAD